jgi:hypothetical protein
MNHFSRAISSNGLVSISQKPCSDNEHDPTDQDSRTSFPDKAPQSLPRGPVWRQDEQAGLSFALKLTAAGVRAITVDDSSASDAMEAAADACRSPPLTRKSSSGLLPKFLQRGPMPIFAPRWHEAGTGPRIASARLWRNARRTDRGDGLASAYHPRGAYWVAQSWLYGDYRPIRQGAGTVQFTHSLALISPARNPAGDCPMF